MPGSSDDHLRQPTVETGVIGPNTDMDAETAKVSDDRTDQKVLRMDQEEDISAEEQARRRLRSKQPARRSLTDDKAVTKRVKREATIAAIKQEILNIVNERSEMMEQAQVLCKHQNNEEPRVDSCVKNGRGQQEERERERGVVERWSREAAMATGWTHVQCTSGGRKAQGKVKLRG